MKLHHFLWVVTLLFITHTIHAQIPFQAKLLENNQPVNGTKNLTFSIQESGINWTETHSNHPITNGLYSVVLGSQNALPANLFDGTNRRTLQISIDGVALTSVKVYQPFSHHTPVQIAILKDVKPKGAPGGDFPANVWLTRTLNTKEGDNSFITLDNNQFTLTKGKYLIEAYVPAYYVSYHKARLRNITDQQNMIVGATRNGPRVSTTTLSNSILMGVIEIDAPKVFEIQHKNRDGFNTYGFGFAWVDSDLDEVYTQVKITKIQ